MAAKHLLISIFIVVYAQTYSQTVYTKVENEMCDCLERKPNENFFTSSYFQQCLDTTLDNNADGLVNAAAEKYGNPNGKMDAFTKYFLDSVQIDLVYMCTVYFKQMDSSRYVLGIKKDKADLQKMLADYKNHPSPGAVYYFNRAEIFFQLGDYTNAMLDINKSLQYNSNNAESYVTKGLLLEQQHKFAEAIEQYRKALMIGYSEESKNSLRMFIAVANRKLKS